MRHVLSKSACAQTALPFCNQNRCLLGPFKCWNVCVGVPVCVLICLFVCMFLHVCLGVVMLAFVCLFAHAALFPYVTFCCCPVCSFPYVCLSAPTYAAIYTCVNVCVRLHSQTRYTVYLRLERTGKKKHTSMEGQFRALSHDLLVSKSNAMI